MTKSQEQAARLEEAREIMDRRLNDLMDQWREEVFLGVTELGFKEWMRARWMLV